MKNTGLIPTGTTAVYGFIGTPIAQVKSPTYFNGYFAQNQIDAVMIPLDVSVEQVAAYFDTMRGTSNLHGCMVTIPHKQAAAKLVDELTPRAKLLGAVNVVRRLEDGRLLGDNVDGQGFVVGNRARGFDLAGKRMALVGGGGVGRAIAYACAEAGVAEIAFRDMNRDIYPLLSQIVAVANQNTKVSFDFESLAGFDLVVNATPVGMDGDDRLPYSLDTVSPDTFVAEVITKPLLTPWLTTAQGKGCRIQYGPDTSKGQMGYIGRFWGFDLPDPVDFD